MFKIPHTESAMNRSAIIIPAVLLLIWLFNSYKMGKFKRTEKNNDINDKIYAKKMVIFIGSIIAIICIFAAMKFLL